MSMNVRINSDTQLKADVAADDSDKSFTVPAKQEWDVQHVRAQLASTATVGNRRVAVEVQDGSGNVLARVQAGIVQAASLTREYNFAPGLADQTAFVNNELGSALPRLRLGPGEVLRVFDIGVVDAAADDLTVRVMVNVNPA